VNSAHIRQSGPDSGPGVQVEVLNTFKAVPSSFESGQLTLERVSSTGVGTASSTGVGTASQQHLTEYPMQVYSMHIFNAGVGADILNIHEFNAGVGAVSSTLVGLWSISAGQGVIPGSAVVANL